MLKELIKEGGLYTIANILTKGVSLLLIPVYTAYFSPADYGIIDILVVFGAFFNAIISLQLTQGLGRYVGEGKISENAKIKFASTAILFTTVCYILAGLVLTLTSEPIIDLLSSDVIIPDYIYYLALASIIINGIFYSFGVYIRFLRQSKRFSILTFAHAFGNIALTLLLVIGLDLGISGVFIASIIVTPILIVIQIILLKTRLITFIGKIELSLMLRFSLPLIPAAVAYALLNFTDRIFINEYLSSNELGIYGIGARFTSIVALIIGGFSMALNPILYENYRDENTPVELSKIFHLYLGIGLIGVLVLSAFSLETLQIFTQKEYYSAYKIMPILYMSVFFTGFWMFSPGLSIKKKTKITASIVILSSCLNVGLNFLLIKDFQLIGASAATLCSAMLNNVLLFYFANKYYPIKLKWVRTLLLMAASILAIYFSAYWIEEQNFSTLLSVFFKCIIILTFIFLVFFSGIIDNSYLKKARLRK